MKKKIVSVFNKSLFVMVVVSMFLNSIAASAEELTSASKLRKDENYEV